MNAWSYFSIFIHEGNLDPWPGRTKMQDLSRTTIEIALLGRKRCVLAVKSAGKISPEDAKAFLGGRKY